MHPAGGPTAKSLGEKGCDSAAATWYCSRSAPNRLDRSNHSITWALSNLADRDVVVCRRRFEDRVARVST